MILILLMNLQNYKNQSKKIISNYTINGRQEDLHAFERGIFPKGKQGKGFSILDQVAHVAKVSDHKLSDGKQLKILTPKQMLQRLPVALAQVKTDNTSVNLLNKVRKVI